LVGLKLTSFGNNLRGTGNVRGITMRPSRLSRLWVLSTLAGIVMLTPIPSLAARETSILRLPGAPRIVAMADWHGDLGAARRGLRLAGAIDEMDRWIGGDLVVVQTGDQLDRGDQERAILDLLVRLGREAAAAGGAVHALLGNHEVMNASGDFRYVTEEGWMDFADLADDPDLAGSLADSTIATLDPIHRPRAAAFRPGGPYALILSEFPVVLIIGRNLFVHGGIRPEHVDYGLERLNTETRRWLHGLGPKPALLSHRDGPLWTRTYCRDTEGNACELLDEVLVRLDCDRLFMGHSIQASGIAAYCHDRIWCMDTGAADYYAGPIQALEITVDGVRVLQ
jgi:hypothetical protein